MGFNRIILDGGGLRIGEAAPASAVGKSLQSEVEAAENHLGNSHCCMFELGISTYIL
jgi:hypothetical protein